MGGCSSTDQNVIRNNYKIQKTQLGVGSFSTVSLGNKKLGGEEVAIKVVNKRRLPEEHLQLMFNEATILRQMKHDNLVKLLDVYETPRKLFIVLEYLKGGSLFPRIVEKRNLTQQKISLYTRQITKAIQHIHANNVCHRDIKPENILFASDDDHSLKLTDFGLASFFGRPDDEEFMTTVCGSPNYIAPEVLSLQKYDQQCDMWSLGVLLYTLLSGFSPFYGEDAKSLFQAVCSGEFEYQKPFWGHICDEAIDLVSNLLVVNPSQRYTAEQVLNHPFITNFDEIPNDQFDESYFTRLANLGEYWRATWEFMVKMGVLEAKSNANGGYVRT